MAEITFTIPADDLVTTDSNEAPRPRQTDKNDVQVAEGVKALQDQLTAVRRERDEDRKRVTDEANARRQAEDRERQEHQAAEKARADADIARKDSASSQRIAIDNAIATATAAMDSAETAYAAAFEAGKPLDAAKAQRVMAEAAADLRQLQAGKQALDAEEAAIKAVSLRSGTDDRRDDRRQPTEQETFDAYVRNMRLPARAERWIRDHPECVTDTTKNAALMRAHHVAEDLGHAFDSDAYYRFIDQKLGYAKAGDMGDGGEVEGDQRRQQQQEDRRMPSVSAPVSRGTSGNSGGGSNRVTLTQDEQDRATDGTLVWNYDDPKGAFKKGDPIGVREFARRKAIMTKEGRYNMPYA